MLFWRARRDSNPGIWLIFAVDLIKRPRYSFHAAFCPAIVRYGASFRIDEIHFLCGHALDGVSEEYTNKLMIEKGPAMRAAQEKISARMFELLGLKLGCHHDAPLVPSLPTREEAKSPLLPKSLKAATGSLEAGQARALERARTLIEAQEGIGSGSAREAIRRHTHRSSKRM